MYRVLDLESTKYYGVKCYLTKAKQHGITDCVNTAKVFKTRELAEKFAKKWFTNSTEYTIIYM